MPVRASNKSVKPICPKCKKGKIKHRQYNLYDCDNWNCEQMYTYHEDKKEFRRLRI